MPDIQAFRGIRYDLGHVGSLSDVVAPPYDVIGPELQTELYKKHPCNVIRLILNRKEPDDDEANNSYVRAHRFLKNWRKEGVLFTEADPALYVYHQEFSLGSETVTRRGFMGRVPADPFGQGLVFPHEQTMKGPKVDRLMLTAVCKANLSQIFGLFPDETNEVQAVLETAVATITPIEATDHLGVVHRLWPVTDVSTIASVSKLMGPKPIFIADGHHRYETACNYREQVRDSGALSKDHPANYVLMNCVAMQDPGLCVLPTHRLFPEMPRLTGPELAEKLGNLFTVRSVGEGPQAAHEAWEDVETTDRQDTLALYTQPDSQWQIVQLSDSGKQKMAQEVANDHCDEWRGLGVSILHRLIVETLLDTPNPAKPTYVHQVEEVVDGLGTGRFPLAALVMPATVNDIRTVSMAGERMPAKSTYFYPKLLSGLVINSLE